MSDQKSNESMARQMLVDLKERLGRPLTTADVLMEFADRANRGEPVDRHDVLAHVDEFLGDVPSKKRAALAENLRSSEFMTALGNVYRESKRYRA
ncbi:MAG: hypothetical protein Q8Q95_02730 [bacterium]|nr:hypothetical protein [bacterium]